MNKNNSELFLTEQEEFTDLREFLKTGEYESCLGEDILLQDKNSDVFFVIVNNCIYSTYFHAWDIDPENISDIVDNALTNEPPCGVLLPYTLKNKNNYFEACLNADDDRKFGPEFSLVGEVKNSPTFSFKCLSLLLNASINDTAGLLAEGTLEVIDFTNDHWIPISRRKTGPTGYSKVGNKWHRPPTVLIYNFDRNTSYILGQDEGTYFGCELQDNPQTVGEAFLSLMPESARKLKNVVRQGEWFFLPVKEDDAPPIEKCIGGFVTGWNEMFFLPLESKDSKKHYVQTYDGRIYNDGKLYAWNPLVTHADHEPCSVQGWVTFVRNTAVRSVSVEGVD